MQKDFVDLGGGGHIFRKLILFPICLIGGIAFNPINQEKKFWDNSRTRPAIV